MSEKIFISIVSHGHIDMIIKNNLLNICNGNDEIKVIIKNNKEDDLSLLDENGNIFVIDSEYYRGFGENNNIVFNYCTNHLGMKDEDYFITINPDIIITNKEIIDLCKKMKANDEIFATINLFKDSEKTSHDNCVRHFPKLQDFFKSFLGLKNKTIINKSLIKDKIFVDWAAGSFLAFKSEHYKNLSGFDKKYFMYCEDIDICYRSKKMGVNLVYYPEIKAIHLAKHANRKIFSKHFYWHVKSILRYCVKC